MADSNPNPNQSSQRNAPPPRNAQDYVAVPRVPYSPPRSRSNVPPSLLRQATGGGNASGRGVLQRPRPGNGNGSNSGASGSSRTTATAPRMVRNETLEDVRKHNLGGGFGPYAHYDASPVPQPPSLPPGANGSGPGGGHIRQHSHSRNRSSISSLPDRPLPTSRPYTSAAPAPPSAPLWSQKDELDPLHDPDPIRDAREDHYCDPLSGRGWLNVTAMLLLCFGLITLFAGYPVITYLGRTTEASGVGYNLGGINGSGQVPSLPGLPTLIDPDTPSAAKTRTGSDGKKYNLVFSDEFNQDDRTFFPGDDAFWEAVDLHYWPTADLEWYTPEAISTRDGSLVITMIEQQNHQLNFQSGMLQSWNKFCFSSGYVEVNVSLPGNHQTAGYWPAAWTMGNLGRAGYGATTEGMWPYTYDSCDVGTYLDQQYKNQTPSVTDQLAGKGGGDTFSLLPGQRLSACSCPGSDHPGPNVGKGRGVPEIDIFEAQIEPTTWQGEVSQSFQVAPFNAAYQFDESGTTIYNTSKSLYNPYTGGAYQQAISVVTDIPNTAYNGQGNDGGGVGWATYGFEYWGNEKDRENAYVTWNVDGVESWTARPGAIAADGTTKVGDRLISEEPMYIIFNLGMAYNFEHQDWMHLQFPAYLMIDYIRVYQRAGQENVGCDPDSHPTADYINAHLPAYNNPNYTTWQDAGFEFPRNSQYDGC